jgi:hypothetical protein
MPPGLETSGLRRRRRPVSEETGLLLLHFNRINPFLLGGRGLFKARSSLLVAEKRKEHLIVFA